MIDRVFDGGMEVQPSRKGPWPKACHDCALRRGDPQNLGNDTQEDLRGMIAAGQMTFFCLHREDGKGKHRECASAKAIATGATRVD